jgi:hypothetical protein
LWLTQLADLVDAPKFGEFWTAAGLSRPLERQADEDGVFPPCPQFPVDPRDYIYEFNRESQWEEVFKVFHPIPTQILKDFDPLERKLASIFFISGRRKDLADEMVTRIQTEIAPAFLGDRTGGPLPLAWDYEGDPTSLLLGLQRTIARDVSAMKLLRLNDLSQVSESAKGQDWMLEIDVSRTTQRDVDILFQFLQAFATFVPTTHPPALYVNITSGESEALAKNDSRIQAFRERLMRLRSLFDNKVTIVEKIYLDDCDVQDIDNWSKKLRRRNEETGKKCYIYLERIFRGRNSFAVRNIKDRLTI